MSTNKMRALFTCILMGMVALSLHAQDIIVMKDGSIVQSKVTEITTTEVKYKKYSNLDGPLYTIDKSTILAINYENGEKETFAAKEQVVTPTVVPEMMSNEVSEEAAAENRRRIGAINNFTPAYQGKDYGHARRCLFVMGVSRNSQLVNDEIEISMETVQINSTKKGIELSNMGEGECKFSRPGLLFSVRNKTNKTIYLDLGNSFFISNGEARAYYSPSATTTSSTSGSGVGVNLGAIAGAAGIGGAVGTLANGINVGGGSSSTTSTVTYSQRVVAIPPMSIKKLDAQLLFQDNQGYVTQGLSVWRWGPQVNFKTNEKEDPIENGEVFSYSENSRTINFSTIIAYSYQENCAETKSCSVSLYAKNAITFPESWNKDILYTCIKLRKTIPDYNRCVYFVAYVPQASQWNWNYGTFPRQ